MLLRIDFRIADPVSRGHCARHIALGRIRRTYGSAESAKQRKALSDFLLEAKETADIVFGLIGWSIVLPTLLGTAIGRWLDNTHPGDRSWTLIFLVAGLSIGCLNAWRWIWNEHHEITKQHEEPEDSPHD